MTAEAGGQIAVAAPAKLNFYLHVVGQRDDGFHLLDSLVCFAAIHDTVILAPAAGLHLSVAGPWAGALSSEPDNLILRAARLLAEQSDIEPNAQITLIKRLPVAAGIGGGSADAAAALQGLVRLWGLTIDGPTLEGLAGQLGADVPVCLRGTAAFVGGIGEELDDTPALPPAPLLLVNPGAALSTPAVFGARSGPFSAADRFSEPPADVPALAALLAQRHNGLTESAIHLQPVVQECLSAIANRPGALLARMSGSGSTCFGLFQDIDACAAAAAHLSAVHSDWWIEATELLTDARKLTPDLEEGA